MDTAPLSPLHTDSVLLMCEFNPAGWPEPSTFQLRLSDSGLHGYIKKGVGNCNGSYVKTYFTCIVCIFNNVRLVTLLICRLRRDFTPVHIAPVPPENVYNLDKWGRSCRVETVPTPALSGWSWRRF